MPECTANGIRLHYEEQGNGPPLLLIMGFGAPAAFWSQEFIDRLARSFRVFAPDNRGTGASEKRDGPVEIATMADDAAALLELAGVRRAHVFGASMGGMIAQELALRHPERVDRLILGCTHPGGTLAVPATPEVVALLMPPRGTTPHDAIAGMWAAMTTEETRHQRKDFLEKMTDRLLARPTPVITLRQQMEAIARFDVAERLGQIAAPTLVLTGDRDILVLPENSRRIAARIPGARLVTVPGTAHNFMWEAQERTAQTIERFLLEDQW